MNERWGETDAAWRNSCKFYAPQRTPPHSQRGRIFVFYSSKPKMFVFSFQSSRPYLKPPQKILGKMGDCRGFAMVSVETYLLIKTFYLSSGCKPQATLQVHYTGNMQLVDAACPENPNLHQGLLSRVPAIRLMLLKSSDHVYCSEQ